MEPIDVDVKTDDWKLQLENEAGFEPLRFGEPGGAG